MSRSAASSLEKLDTKALPLSLITASGSLWCLQTCLRKRCATPAVGRIVPCTLHCSFYMILYHKTYGGTSSLGIPRKRSGITPRSNNTKYPGFSYEAIAIYLKEFCKELTK